MVGCRYLDQIKNIYNLAIPGMSKIPSEVLDKRRKLKLQGR